MNRITATTIAAALGTLTAPVMAQDSAPAQMSAGQAELAELLEGRVSGTPEDCIQTIRSRSFKVINGTALVYEQGDTLWVNTTRNPESIDEDDVLVIDRFNGARLCRTDQVTLRDRSTQFFSGILFFDDFVPYRRPGS